METAEKNFKDLHALSREAKIIEGVSHLISWDQETYMPPGGASIRAEQMKVLKGIHHSMRTSPSFSQALGKLVDLETGCLLCHTLPKNKQAAVREWYRDYKNEQALPKTFVEEYAQLTSNAVMAWRSAKESGAFQQFAPFLDKIIQMNRQKAEYLQYDDHPYDALLDEFEPGLRTREVATLFGDLKAFLTPHLQHLNRFPVDQTLLNGHWDHSKQMTFCHKILDAIGYDMHHGRLDLSSHPFSSACHPTDSRITTRIHPHSLTANILTVLHEAGHALYEMGLSQEYYGSPLGEARSLGVHESQSKWWETRIGMSLPFWKHYYPLLQDTFTELKLYSLDQFYRALNAVHPSFIRVEADEVTYPLHVILRFEIEKSLIEGSLNVRELPEAWNEKMKQLLGIEPKHNGEGCLQDIHWSLGCFGYFPTYTLGNLYAAQLFETFEAQQPDWGSKVEKGEFRFIKEWLHQHIYQHGREYPTLEMIKNVTGKEFSAVPYLNYLRNKYPC